MKSKPFALVALAVACLLAVAVGQNNTAPPADSRPGCIRLVVWLPDAAEK